MDIGQAIQAMREGKCVARAGWNGKNMHIYLEEHMSWPVPGGVFKGDVRQYEPVICMFTTKGTHQPGWLANQPDLLATDWEIAKVD